MLVPRAPKLEAPAQAPEASRRRAAWGRLLRDSLVVMHRSCRSRGRGPCLAVHGVGAGSLGRAGLWKRVDGRHEAFQGFWSVPSLAACRRERVRPGTAALVAAAWRPWGRPWGQGLKERKPGANRALGPGRPPPSAACLRANRHGTAGVRWPPGQGAGRWTAFPEIWGKAVPQSSRKSPEGRAALVRAGGLTPSEKVCGRDWF